MRRKKWLVIAVFAITMLAISIDIAYRMQKNKESVNERIKRVASETDAETKNTDVIAENEVSDQEKTKETASEIIGDNILMVGTVKMELLSVDILEGDDIGSETRYPVEFFQNEKLPESNLEQEIVDWDSICEISPEVREAHMSGSDVYPVDKAMEVYDRNRDLIDQYTYTVIKPQKVYFIKCRLTNMFSYPVEDALPYEVTIKSSDTGAVTYQEDIRYFDKPIYTDDETRYTKYFFYKLDGYESMECTIGLVVAQEFGENEKHYYGKTPGGENPSDYDPSALPDFVDIDALPRTEENDL